MQDLFNAFKFFSENIHILGWLSLVLFTIKTSFKLSQLINKVVVSVARLERTEATVELLATNHLPHLQIGIDQVTDAINESTSQTISELKGIRSDLFQVALRKD